MANSKQSQSRRLKMSERAQQQLALHFPDVTETLLWRRKSNDGFTTVPRTLPIAMQAIDDTSKGAPAGHSLFCLWARAPDNPLVTVENPATFAAEAGFTGERAVDTWRKRMRRLRELGFVRTKKGPSGEFHFILLLNPNVAVEMMRANGLVQVDLYGRFVERVADVGAAGDWPAHQEAMKAAEEKAAAAAKAASKAAAAPKAAAKKGAAK
ncbi:hypothetical protein QTH91_18805 [Variovorax dokdonensis]|uniref:Uncharacterized protein n=1 Tax=Variovorax dokdonensis TaxID=344883 RepID=A0ABT7NF34_9BURK|nr:hypothetical protein [Variovorax dokdonensis]MDM0046548.1 hypothetical protein [Variovorax dokdonensis]